MSNLGTLVYDLPKLMFNEQLRQATETVNEYPNNVVIQFKTVDDKDAFAEYLEPWDEWQVFTSA